MYTRQSRVHMRQISYLFDCSTIVDVGCGCCTLTENDKGKAQGCPAHINIFKLTLQLYEIKINTVLNKFHDKLHKPVKGKAHMFFNIRNKTTETKTTEYFVYVDVQPDITTVVAIVLVHG